MSFKVHVKPSGHDFTLESGATILDGALRQGLAFPYGCRNGTCGSCKGKILEGEIEHGESEVRALSDAEKLAGMALFCQAKPLTDVTIQVREFDTALGITVKTLPCRLVKMEQVAHDVMHLFLKIPATERLQFLAGQYIDILLRDGRRRSFSIANAPHHDEFIELHIRHVEGGRFTSEVFSSLKEKAILRFQGPLGNFYLREDSTRPIILVAGGTGFGPIKAIVEHAIAKEIKRPMHIYWGVRARRDLYMDGLPREWAATQANVTYTPVLSMAMEEDHWLGRRGYVHTAVVEDFADLGAYEVYASGPPPMVQAGHVAFTAHGLLPEHFYTDPFEFSKDPPGAAN